MKLLFFACFLPLLFICPFEKGASASANALSLKSTENIENFYWIGHRGSNGPFVSNTMPAFKEGISRGYQALECDIKMTRDGHFIIFHNAYLNTGSGERVITEPVNGSTPESKTLAEIREMTVTQTRSARYGPEGTFTGQIATLEEFLDLCKENNVIAVLDLKWTTGINNNDQSNVEKLIKFVEDAGWLDNTIFLTSMRPVLEEIRSYSSDISLQYLCWTAANFRSHKEWLFDHNISLGLAYNEVSSSIINEMQERDLVVNAFTLNEVGIANTLIGYGIDMITTDYLYHDDQGEVKKKEYDDVEKFGGIHISPKEKEVKKGRNFNFEVQKVVWGDSIALSSSDIDWEIIDLEASYGRGGFYARDVSEGYVVALYQETESDTARVLIYDDSSANQKLQLPDSFHLFQNYPNPFNPETHIHYHLPVKATTRLAVYDVSGREIALLVNEKQEAGSHSVIFDASHLASGTYIYELYANAKKKQKKMMLIK